MTTPYIVVPGGQFDPGLVEIEPTIVEQPGVTLPNTETNDVAVVVFPSSPPVPDAQPPTALSSAQLDPETFYRKFEVQVAYVTKMGKMALPVAGPEPQNQEIVQLAAPFTYKVVYWVVRRYNAKPVLPHWDTGNSNEVLIYRLIGAPTPTVLNDAARFLWSVEGLYIYALKRSVTDAVTLSTGTVSALQQPASAFGIEPYQFDHTLLQSIT